MLIVGGLDGSSRCESLCSGPERGTNEAPPLGLLSNISPEDDDSLHFVDDPDVKSVSSHQTNQRNANFYEGSNEDVIQETSTSRSHYQMRYYTSEFIQDSSPSYTSLHLTSRGSRNPS